MRWSLALLVVFLAACQNSASDDILIQKARRSAGLPECASLRALDGEQDYIGEGTYRVVAEFAASPQCIENWKRRLEANGWSRGQHGIWYRPGALDSVSLKNGAAAVIWAQDHAEEGIPIRTSKVEAGLGEGRN